MRYVSMFSGAGGGEIGCDAAGWECAAQVEYDPWCIEVLARRWPDVPRWGDIRTVNGAELPAADAVVFGSPCQDLSVAGKRAGLAGDKSGLFREAIRVIGEMRAAGNAPRWVVWENVYGALSSNAGRDFAAVLDAMAECGALVLEWAVLDARWFGVPQRRRRVFVVACCDPVVARGCPDPLLPQRPSRPRHPRKSGEAGQAVAALTARGVGTCGADDNQAQAGHLIPAQSVAQNKRGELRLADDAPSLSVGGGKPGQGYPAVLTAYPLATRGRDDGAQLEMGEADTYNALRAGNGGSSRANNVLTPQLAVRRLTPVECERLQGWPDHHTATTSDGRAVADSHRYRMAGNGIAAPVMAWVAHQITTADQSRHVGDTAA